MDFALSSGQPVVATYRPRGNKLRGACPSPERQEEGACKPLEFEGAPGPLSLGEAVGYDPEGCRVVTEAAVTTGYLHALTGVG